MSELDLYAPAPARKSHRGLIALCIVAAVLIAAGVATVFLISRGSVDPAAKACESTVRANLTAPSTAKFGGIVTAADPQVVGRIHVTGYVDAENTFGAMVRQTFSCDVTNDGTSTDVTGSFGN